MEPCTVHCGEQPQHRPDLQRGCPPDARPAHQRARQGHAQLRSLQRLQHDSQYRRLDGRLQRELGWHPQAGPHQRPGAAWRRQRIPGLPRRHQCPPCAGLPPLRVLAIGPQQFLRAAAQAAALFAWRSLNRPCPRFLPCPQVREHETGVRSTGSAAEFARTSASPRRTSRVTSKARCPSRNSAGSVLRRAEFELVYRRPLLGVYQNAQHHRAGVPRPTHGVSLSCVRSFFLFLSHLKWLRRWMETSSLARRLSTRFVAGETLEDALAVARKLNAEGITVTLDHLGESVSTLAEAAEA